MTRLLLGAACGLVLGVVVGAAANLHADPVRDEIAEAATVAHVDPIDLAGAVATTGQDPYSYLRGTGELPPLPIEAPPKVLTPAPPTNARVACIESRESQGRNIANLHGSGAVGVLQYMVPTFKSHAAEMGHSDWSPWVPWQARAVAAHDLAMGRRSQWTVGGC